MTRLPDRFAHSLRPTAPDGAARRLNTWQSVRAEVLHRIRSGEWAPGELIPTEHELAAELGCARATVNRALRELAENGVVERRRKVGTRVTASPAQRTTLEMPSLRSEIEAAGAEYGYKLTGFALSVPTDTAMRALQVGPRDEMILVKAQHLANGRAHCWETIWLNPRNLPAVSREVFEEQPAHEWLARALPLTRSRLAIMAEGASGDCALHLGIPDGTPVLAIERVIWHEAMPVSFARQFYPPRHRLISED